MKAEYAFKLGKAIAAASKPAPNEIREGQHVFNVVYEFLPEAANELRGSMVDPFYKDHRIPLFWTAVIDTLEKMSKGTK